MTESTPGSSSAPTRVWWRSLGPALIMAAVVLGPGTILTSSRVGCAFGYDLLWLLATVSLLMAGTTALAAHLGSSLPTTLCGEIANRWGRPMAGLIGVTLFLVVAGFQTSNNVAVVTALDPFWAGATDGTRTALAIGVLIVLNLAVIGTVLYARKLYRRVETLMKFCIGLMVLAFAANLAVASPSVVGILSGLIPNLPEGLSDGWLPRKDGDQIIDPVLAVQGMIATTFSIAGAFYQAYLVREKGWTREDLRTGLVDSIFGVFALGAATAMILITAAATLHANGVPPENLGGIDDVAVQLRPLLGDIATTLFSVGILAGALSSFLVNAMIGGTLFSDGFGLGSSIEQTGPKIGTVAALLFGMIVALINIDGENRINVIVVAQALTVLGGPLLGAALLFLGFSQRNPNGSFSIPTWILVTTVCGFVLTTLLAARTAVRLWLMFS